MVKRERIVADTLQAANRLILTDEQKLITEATDDRVQFTADAKWKMSFVSELLCGGTNLQPFNPKPGPYVADYSHTFIRPAGSSEGKRIARIMKLYRFVFDDEKHSAPPEIIARVSVSSDIMDANNANADRRNTELLKGDSLIHNNLFKLVRFSSEHSFVRVSELVGGNAVMFAHEKTINNTVSLGGRCIFHR